MCISNNVNTRYRLRVSPEYCVVKHVLDRFRHSIDRHAIVESFPENVPLSFPKGRSPVQRLTQRPSRRLKIKTMTTKKTGRTRRKVFVTGSERDACR